MFILWRHHFRRDHAIRTNSKLSKIQRPFARQSIHASLGSRVSRSSTLSRFRNLGSNIHYIASTSLQRIQAMMHQGITLGQVLLQRFAKRSDACLQVYAIIHSRIIHHNVDTAKFLKCLSDRVFNILFIRHLRKTKCRLAALTLKLCNERLALLAITSEDHYDRAFCSERSRDPFAYSFIATGNDGNFALQIQIHKDNLIILESSASNSLSNRFN